MGLRPRNHDGPADLTHRTKRGPGVIGKTQAIHLATNAMGTRFEIALRGHDPIHLRAAGEEAIELIEDAHRRLSRFERGSAVGEINAAAGSGVVPLDDELFDLFDRCEQYRAQTNNAFTVVFRSKTEPGPRRAPPRHRRHGPNERPPHETTPPPRPQLTLDRQRRTAALPAPDQYLDLGGVAKGFALDLAARTLREAGVQQALLHGGTSTVVVIGGPRNITLPLDDTPAAGPVASLENLALSFSSQHGDRPGHIIDPRTRTRARAAGAAHAACLARSAELTDAWATALVVLGRRPASAPPALTTVLRASVDGTLSPETRWTIRGPHADAVAAGTPDGAHP